MPEFFSCREYASATQILDESSDISTFNKSKWIKGSKFYRQTNTKIPMACLSILMTPGTEFALSKFT